MTQVTAASSLPEAVSDVIDVIKQRQKKYGFSVNQDSVLSAVMDAAEIFSIELSQPEIIQACTEMVPNYAG